MVAVILAGGKGTRLQPFTISLPKPLMPVCDYPILEILIRQLKKAGITRIIIAVGYHESLIRAYFGNGAKLGVEIMYSSENEPLGTAGPLKLIKSELTETFFFMNGDTLSDFDFNVMLDFHRQQKAIATVGLTKRTVDIDFGVVKIDAENRFSEWQEKPTLEYLVSTGIYIFQPEVIDYLPDGFFNVPDLINLLDKKNERIIGFLHKGFWLDIGRLEDYQAACKYVEKKGLEFE